MADAELQRACFEVVTGPQPGPEPGLLLPLLAATTTLGRVPGNTHVLKDAAISRQHAKVFVRDGRHWLADLNSSHGTFVNGVKVTLHTLVDGDQVKLGTTVLRYVAAPQSTSTSHGSGAPPVASVPPKPASASGPMPPPTAPSDLVQGPPSKPPAPLHPADAGTGSFELELPESGVPPSPATRGPLPPVSTSYRRGVTASGEDPFADEPAESGETDDPGASRGSGGPASNGGVRERAPSIELRGETARQFARRGSSAPASAAPATAAAATRAPPPLHAPSTRTRGPFSFVRDELDQRGPAARAIATLFALAVAAALFWLALRAFEAVPKSEAAAPSEESVPVGPLPPQLPPR